jgi:hypothetical protein
MRGTHAFAHVPRVLGRNDSRGPLTAVHARLCAPSIDRRLAAGAPPWESSLLAARALQITREHRRRSLARALERLAANAERPASRAISSVVPVCRQQVREALPTIFSLAARLGDGRPVDARGVARLYALISEGTGPFYVTARPGALDEALKEAYRGLDVND